jgi:xylan 1,4-beta-xylosidase
LYLSAGTTATGNFLAQKTITGNYQATVKINAKKSNASTGIGIIGDENNLIVALFENDSVGVIQIKDEKETVISKKQLTAGEKFYLRVMVSNANEIKFQYSLNGNAWNQLNDTTVDGSFLPPWDRAVRVGVISKGASDTQAVFDAFELINKSKVK